MQGVANDWFASCLSNRRHFVSLFHRNCDCQTVAYVEYHRDQCLKFHLFADDTNFFPNNTNILNLEPNIKGELQNMSLWFYVNNLSLNIEKPIPWYSIRPQRRIADKCNLSTSNMSVKSDNKVKINA